MPEPAGLLAVRSLRAKRVVVLFCIDSLIENITGVFCVENIIQNILGLFLIANLIGNPICFFGSGLQPDVADIDGDGCR